MLDRIVEFTGMLLGLLYLFLEYKADKRMWIVGIIMPMISVWVYFNAGLYADFAIAIYYFLAAVYGYWVWTKSKRALASETVSVSGSDSKAEPCLPITHVPAMTLFVSLGITGVLWVAIYFVLVTFTNSTVPLCDAFTTALSITGMYLLAQKYVEQWIVWVIVDAVSVGLYFYKGIYFYSCLNVVYTVVAVMGYFKWLKHT